MAGSSLPPARKAVGHAAALAAMLAIAAPFVASWEGKRNAPYRDVVGVLTVCYGETRMIDPNKVYSNDECAQQLQEGLSAFGEFVGLRVPAIETSRFEWAAHTSFAYNVGRGAYKKSSIRTAFAAGNRVEACRNMRKYKYAGKQAIAGLVYRREGHLYRIGEYELCLAGAVPFELTGEAP